MPEALLRAIVSGFLSPTHTSKSTRGVYSNPRMRVSSVSIGTLVPPLASVLGGTNKQATTNPYVRIWSVVMEAVTSIAYPRIEAGLSGASPSLLPKQSFDPARGMAVQIAVPHVVAASVTTDLSD
jgi:hypothetical protein